MHQLRRDPITGRWVVVDVDPEKTWRIEQFDIEPHILKGGSCAFCPGQEEKTPPEILAFREDGSHPNTRGWLVRVVPNKFPALKIEGNLDRSGIGVYDMMNGIGAHEVIIENPDHTKNIMDLDPVGVERVIWAYVNRSIDLRGDQRFKYTLIFKNWGDSAGASLEHPHSQLIALPIVPKRISEELTGAERYFEYRDRCVFCDMLRQELDDHQRLILDNDNFVAFAPFISRFPFEMWILPKVHLADFTAIQKHQVQDLARILKEILLRMKGLLHDPSFNYMIHTAPLEDRYRDDYHWRIEITPRLTRVAGFEWGSDIYFNPIAPEVAAKSLREVKIETHV